MVGSCSRRRDEGVSPVIATILMVAVTVVISAVLFVLVLAIADVGDIAPDGVLRVESVDEDTYHISVRAVTFSISGDSVRFVINNIEPPSTLNSYTRASPFVTPDGLISYSSPGNTPLNVINKGSYIILELDESLRQTVVKVALVSTQGKVIAQTSFVATGTLPSGPVDPPADPAVIPGAQGSGVDVTSFPLVFAAGDRYVTVPQSTYGPVQDYLRISIGIKFQTTPTPGTNILSINANDGFSLRTERSGGNDRLLFSAKDTSVRSNGAGGGIAMTVQSGIDYDVICIYDRSLGVLQIFISDDGEPPVLRGSVSYSSTPPQLGVSDWFLGAGNDGTGPTGPYFRGQINHLSIMTSPP